MLMQILDFLHREKITSNQQIAREFHIEPSALEPMLKRWIEKGRIALCQNNKGCQSACFKCKANSLLYYQYIN